MKNLFSHFYLFLVVSASCCLHAFGQGNDNPTGVAGVSSGNIMSSSGGSYLIYSANAQRIIPDLTVAGAVAAYPLQWVRIMNSRGAPAGVFGEGGGWSHSYQWSCSAATSTVGPAPLSYTVSYPDGREVTFAANIGTPYLAPIGVTDRFGGLPGNTYVYLTLTDGGVVRFYQTYTSEWDPETGQTEYTFTISAPDQIIDPHGQITTLTYTSGNLTKVSEPGGRYLLISYGTNGYVSRVDSYTAANHQTQWVTYTYATQPFGGQPYTVLSRADYIYSPGAEPAPVAYYTYQTSNKAPTGNPLISTCQDVRYPGPMKNISYAFVRTNPLSYGELSQEKNLDGTAVTTLTMNGTSGRIETRGDGAQRTFTYGATAGTTTKNYLLKTYTDFEGNATTLSYNADGFVSSAEDANHHMTSFEYLNDGFPTGVIKKITHPGDGSTIQYFYTDATGAFLDYMIDEVGNRTTYKRNAPPANTAYEIDYQDGGVEGFEYNVFGQVLNHTVLTGGVEKYTYDSTGLLEKYAPPATPLDGDPNPDANPTIYGYDINDHLSTITDPNGNVTTLFHNEIGQLTIEEHPDHSLVRHSYNADTTLASTSVQFGPGQNDFALTSYAYDDYKRLSAVTNPLGKMTNFWYDKNGTEGDGYGRIESAVTRLKLPSAKVTKTLYDNNWRKISVTVGLGSGNDATTSYTYDGVGNLKTMKEPNGQASGATWNYNYDERDRLLDITDPIAADQNSKGHTIDYTYDAAGNKKTERRANDQVVTYDIYDGRNRITQMTVPQAPTTAAVSHYTWTKFGKLDTFTDPRGKIYDYDYDLIGRLQTLTYPADGTGTVRKEFYTYDKASNVATFKNRIGNTKTFTYDNRNRQTLADWNTNGQDVATTYDEASRVTQVVSGTTTVAFGYDAAGQKLWEDQTITGRPTRRVNFTPDDDGNRATLSLTGAYSLNYDYTGRNQLWHIKSGTTSWYEYTYDVSGNLTNRQDKVQGLDSTIFGYDAVNRVNLCTQTGANDTAFAWSHYTYDKVGNIQTTWRDEQSGLGEVFGYDQNNQVIGANYNVAMTTPTPTPTATPTPTVATPTFVPVAGAYPASDYPKNITVSTTTSGAHICYTTDGTTPSESNGMLINGTSGVASVAVGKTLKAIGLKTDYIDSAIKSGAYTQATAVAIPTFVPVAGAYPASDYPKNITVSTTTSGAHIRYTTNGTDPSDSNGTLINGTSGVASVAVDNTLKAIGLKDGLTDSAIKSGAYTQAAAVAIPTFNPAAGGYKSQNYPMDIVVSTTTSAAHIRYTTDGTTPSETQGTLINASSGTVPNLAAGKTLKAIGLKTGMTDSGIKSGAFTALPPCATPVLNPPEVISGPHPPAAYTVNVSTTTSGASLSYTRDNSTPTPTHGTIVSATSTNVTIAPQTFITLKAIAFKSSGYSDSGIVSGYFDNQNDGGNGPQGGASSGGEAKAGRQSSAGKQLVAAASKKFSDPVTPAEAPGGARWAMRFVDNFWKQANAGQSNLTLNWTSGRGGQQGADAPESARYVTYTLDSAGNRTNMNDGGSVSYVPNNLNQYGSVGGSSVDYDNNGNLSSYGGWSYYYDADNRLTSATGGGHTVNFGYDGLGRCVQRTIDGNVTTFTYDGWKPIAEWGSANQLAAWNLYGPGADEILMRYQPGAAVPYLHYHSDQFGNVKFLLDGSNVGKEKYTYDAFGAPTVTNWDGTLPRSESNFGNRFMFNGREYLPEANVYDYRVRAYSSELGRFLQADPIGFAGDPANLYRYCGNNPVNLSDPWGFAANNKTDSSGWTLGGQPYPHDASGIPNIPDGGELPRIAGPGSLPEPFSNPGGADSLFGHGGGPKGGGGGRGHGIPSGHGTEAGSGGSRIDPHLLSRFGPTPADAASMTHFANALDTSVSIYVGFTIGGWEGPAVRGGVTVLGRWPGYIKLAEKLGANHFNIPMEGFPQAEQWAANSRFLDRVILRGDRVELSIPASSARAGSFFARELEYLSSRGYSLSSDGLSLSPIW